MYLLTQNSVFDEISCIHDIFDCKKDKIISYFGTQSDIFFYCTSLIFNLFCSFSTHFNTFTKLIYFVVFYVTFKSLLVSFSKSSFICNGTPFIFNRFRSFSIFTYPNLCIRRNYFYSVYDCNNDLLPFI